MTQNSIQRRYRRQWQSSKENIKQDSKLNSTEKSNIRCWHSLLINGHRSFMCTCKHHEGGGYSEHPSVKSFQQFLVRRRGIQKIPGMDFPRFEFFSDINRGCIPPQWEQGSHIETVGTGVPHRREIFFQTNIIRLSLIFL